MERHLSCIQMEGEVDALSERRLMGKRGVTGDTERSGKRQERYLSRKMYFDILNYCRKEQLHREYD